MTIVNFDVAVDAARESIRGIDVLSFRAPVGGGHPPKVGYEGENLTFDKIQMLPSGVESMCKLVGVPFAYMKKCSPDVQAYNLNYHVKRSGFIKSHKALSKEGRIQQWIPQDKTLISDLAVLDVFAEVVAELGEFAVIDADKSWFSPVRSNFSIYFTEARTLVTASDVLYPGFTFDNSIIGKSDPCIGVYIYRTVCSNGLRRKLDSFNAEEVLTMDMDYRNRIKPFLLEALPQAKTEVDRVVKLRDVPVDDPNKSVTAVAKQLRLPAQQREALLFCIDPENPPETMYDVLNLLTSYANTQGAQAAAKLQTLAGSVVELAEDKEFCVSCHSLIDHPIHLGSNCSGEEPSD